MLGLRRQSGLLINRARLWHGGSTRPNPDRSKLIHNPSKLADMWRKLRDLRPMLRTHDDFDVSDCSTVILQRLSRNALASAEGYNEHDEGRRLKLSSAYPSTSSWPQCLCHHVLPTLKHAFFSLLRKLHRSSNCSDAELLVGPTSG